MIFWSPWLLKADYNFYFKSSNVRTLPERIDYQPESYTVFLSAVKKPAVRVDLTTQ